MKISTRKSGFTLIELVVVIAVISILAVFLLPTILGQVERARLSRGRADVKELAVAIARLRTDTSVSTAGCLTDFQNLTELSNTVSGECIPGNNPPGGLTPCATENDPSMICWGGPYISNITNDPWSVSYYASEDTNFTVTVHSNGPDGQPLTADDITFIQ